MQAFVGWFVVVSLGATAVLISVELTTGRVSGRAKGYRAGAITMVGSAIGLVVLATLWKIRQIADLDASVVTLLATKRSSGVTSVMSLVTTIGDPIPSFTIAAVLAVVVYQQGRYQLLPVLMPLAVVVELVAQISIAAVFHDVSIAQLHPALPLGGAGAIPSGSVARLFSIFLIAAQLWGPRGTRSRGLITVGTALVTIQLISRLYLGRHLLADILGGLLLGIVIERAARLLLTRLGVVAAETSPARDTGVEASR